MTHELFNFWGLWTPGFRGPRSASAERSWDRLSKKHPCVEERFPQNEFPRTKPHIFSFPGISKRCNQRSALSHQPTTMRLFRCCLPLLNLVGSCVHAVPIIWCNNRTLVLILSRGKCRRGAGNRKERGELVNWELKMQIVITKMQSEKWERV